MDDESGLGGGEVGRGDADVPDVATGQLEPEGEEVEIDVVGLGQRGRQVALPQQAAMLLFGQREVDDRIEPANERLVDVRPKVGGEDREAVEHFHPLEQVGDFDVRVPVTRVLDLGALAEEGVRLVEQQDRR